MNSEERNAKRKQILAVLHANPKATAVMLVADLLELLLAAVIRLDDEVTPQQREKLYEEILRDESRTFYGRAVKPS